MTNELNDSRAQATLEGTVFPRLPEFLIEPGHTALLTLDMQYASAHPDFGLGRRAKDIGRFELLRPFFEDVLTIVRNIEHLHVASRRAGIKVIHVRTMPNPTTILESGPRRMRDREHDILKDLKVERQDISLTTITSSAFLATSLEVILRNLGVDTLLCCGVTTDGCVEGTVRVAGDLGFKPVVVSDGCAAYTRDRHQHALRLMAGRGNVRTTQEIVALLDPYPSTVARPGPSR